MSEIDWTRAQYKPAAIVELCEALKEIDGALIHPDGPTVGGHWFVNVYANGLEVCVQMTIPLGDDATIHPDKDKMKELSKYGFSICDEDTGPFDVHPDCHCSYLPNLVKYVKILLHKNLPPKQKKEEIFLFTNGFYGTEAEARSMPGGDKFERAKPSEFIKKAREAKHDSLGLSFDPESSAVLSRLSHREEPENKTAAIISTIFLVLIWIFLLASIGVAGR